MGSRGASSSIKITTLRKGEEPYYGTINDEEHIKLVEESRQQWGEDIKYQKGYVRTGISFDVNEALRNLDDDVDATKVDLGSKNDWGSGEKWDFNNITNNMDILTSQPITGGKARLLTRFVGSNWAKNVFGTTDINQIKEFVGHEFKEKGFMSTSSVPSSNVFTARPYRIEIEAGAKTRGFVADNKWESEVVLPRNSRFKVKSIDSKNGQYVIRVKVMDTPDNGKGKTFKEVLHR